MTATARLASPADISTLANLYDGLLAEMIDLKPVWSITDALAEPISEALAEHIERDSDRVYLGEYDGVPLGFLIWRRDRLLPQGDGSDMAVIRHIYTDPAARRVGVGEAMINLFLDEAAQQGIGLFDAIVPPGHRHAKNFFESNGFKARRIVMHRDDREG